MDDLSELIFGSGVGLGLITDLENGPDGRLYVVQYSTGSVTRIAPVPGAVVDLDADEVDDACDCDATDGSAFAVPTLVPTLRVNSKPSTTLGWDGQAATAGTGTVYRVVSGTLDDLKMFGYGTACTLDPGASTPQSLDTRTPAPATSFYYLVEAANGCGRSGFGDGSNVPDPRDVLDGSNPPACM